LSIRLQQCLNAAIGHAGRRVTKRWWFSGGVDIPAEVLEDVATVYHSLDDNAEHPVWQSYIGFLVERAPTARIISDAAYEGLGGWSEEFNFMWRVSCEDLARMGFSMKRLQAGTPEPDIDAAGLHINILEFVAIIVNIWMIIVLSRSRSSPVGGHIFAVFADNTSALSWRRYASRSHRPNVCRLAQFVSALLFASGFQGKVQGKHLTGLANRGADALSRCRKYPTWACATRRCSHLLLELSSVPPAARALFASSLDHFRNADRGRIRAGNDGTLEARALHFARWLQRLGYDYESIAALSPAEGLTVVGVFLRCVASGDTIRTSKNNIMAKTLGGYATAAGIWCAHHFALQVPIYLAPSLAGKATLHPFLAETINQRRKWQQPQR
jgi:hypothetical protein